MEDNVQILRNQLFCFSTVPFLNTDLLCGRCHDHGNHYFYRWQLENFEDLWGFVSSLEPSRLAALASRLLSRAKDLAYQDLSMQTPALKSGSPNVLESSRLDSGCALSPSHPP